MRRRILVFSIVLMIAIACIIPNAFALTAEDGARIITGNEEDEIMPISEDNEVMPILEEDEDIVPMDTINEDVYDFSENVEKNNENVNGNVYLFANGVNIDNEIINGDVFICGNNVQLGKDVIINGNTYISALNTKVEATITRGLYIVGKDVILDKTASVKYDANICADHIILCGVFDREINVLVNNMEVTSDAVILGNLNYISDKEASISDDAIVNNINFEKQIAKSKKTIDIVYDYVLDFTQYFVLTFVIFIIVMKFRPNFIGKSKECVRVNSFGLGIVTIVLTPIIFIVMMMLKATATIAIAILIMLLAVLIISMAVTNISISAKLSDKFKKIKLPIMLAIVTVVSWTIFQIPFFGGIVAFFMVATGLGIVIRANFVKEK